jgi:ABC-type transport system involved in multi-copper enzyme maturation permease subunit
LYLLVVSSHQLARCCLASAESESTTTPLGRLDRVIEADYSQTVKNPLRIAFAMTSPVHSCQLWLRRNLSWSNSRQAWEERLGALALFAGIAAVWWSADLLPLWQQACLWTLLLVAVGILLRRGWLKLLGPLFVYEVVRAARRSRYVLLRLYVYFILLIFLFIFLCWWVLDQTHTLTLPAPQAAEVIRSFFNYFVIAQLMLVSLLTPGYTAGALAEEKDRRTLEALLATDLRNREIVLSKLVVRLANLALMLLTGLPILGLLQFLGGIDPDLIVAGLVATGLTMVSLASLGILNSVYAGRARDAILYTYLEVAAYVLVSGLSQLLHMTSLVGWTIGWGSLSFLLGDAVDWFSAGNPAVVLGSVMKSVAFGGALAQTLPVLLRDYALLHGVLAVLFTTWAAVRLRAVFLKQASCVKQHSSAGRWLRQRRVGNWPMIWKEVSVESGIRFNWFGRILMIILLLASLLPALAIELTTSRTQVREAMSHWTRIVGAMVACLLLVGVAVRAANSISSERDRMTWDGLLTTPLGSNAILFAKWLGSLLSIRWGWLWLLTIWGLGSAEGGLHLLAVPVLLLAWTVYAGLLATVGLWFSLICQTSLRAIIWTLFTILAVVAGFLVLPVYSSPFFQIAGPDAFWVRWLYRLNMGLAPPVALGRMLPFGWGGHLPGLGRKQRWEMEFALLGLACWATAAVVLWFVTSWQFRRMTGRQTQRRPDNLLSNNEETGLGTLSAS